jgi:hypothetical protein
LTGLNNLTTGNFAASGQTVSLNLTGSGSTYTAPITLNNPLFGSSTFIKYSSGILTSTYNAITSTEFSVATGKDGYLLSGTMNLTYIETPVAKIGNTEYLTLAAAVAAVQNGETITLLTDVALSATLNLNADKTYTLDLDGKKISNGALFDRVIYATAGTVTIQNGEIRNTFSASTALRVESCTVSLSELDIRASSNDGVAVAAFDGAKVSILSGDYYGGDNAVSAIAPGTAVTITAGHFACGDDRSFDGCLSALVGGTITLAAGSAASVTPWLNNTSAKDVTITGGVTYTAATLPLSTQSSTATSWSGRNGKTVYSCRPPIGRA